LINSFWLGQQLLAWSTASGLVNSFWLGQQLLAWSTASLWWMVGSCRSTLTDQFWRLAGRLQTSFATFGLHADSK
jgi:hypothetical protein